MRSFIEYINKPKLILDGFIYHFFEATSNLWSDKLYIKCRYLYKSGKWLNLESPATFNEKLNWLKLYYHNPLLHKLVDKYEVKQYVRERIGNEYVVPCLGVYDSFDDIDFDKLPDRFIIKGTLTDCLPCLDKSKLDIDSLKYRMTREGQKHDWRMLREWGYKDVRQRFLVDALLEDGSGHEIQDYKWWCFNGVPKVMYITNKGKNIYENFYDMDFNILDIDHGFPRFKPEYNKPTCFELMKELASKLSQGLPFVRIDFFFINNQVYFGEFTFYDWGGMQPFSSNSWDDKLGSWINLPPKML